MGLRMANLIVVAFATMAFYSANATTFYVATDGNDANDGLSSQSAFLTLAKAASYVNCYSELTINETSPAVADPGFSDVAEKDCSLTNSPLINKGTDYAAAGGISEFDLAGNKRLIGSRIDIGCYEAPLKGFLFIVR